MPTVKLTASSYSVTGSVTVTNPDRMYTDVSSTTYATLTHTTSGTTSYYCYIKGFNFSAVPDDAIVSSITIRIRGYESNLSTSTSYAPRLYNSTSTITGASAASSNFGTSASTITVPYTGDWATLKGYGSNLGIRVTVRRSSRNTQGYLYIYGAEIEVTYTVPVYHSVTISNSTSATVTASESNPLEGTDVEIRSDTLSGITITDNGVDVTSQFTQRQDSGASYDVVNVGTYGFPLNSQTGYYTSNNKGINKSAAVCRIDLHLPVAADITFSFINYAEQGYDFGVFGNVDVALSNSYYAAGSSGATITDSSYKLACNTNTYNKSTVQTLTYSNVSSGDHSIWVKYSKDDGTSSNNDTLQFSVAITLIEPFTPTTYYGYDITNIQADHAIVVAASGNLPPVITVGTPSRSIISDESGVNQCTCTFTSDLPLQAWEARATKGVTPARGVGLLVESGTTLAAGATGTVVVDWDELTNGDGEYVITVYGQSTDGVWSA